jgi:hypothetical protein
MNRTGTKQALKTLRENFALFRLAFILVESLSCDARRANGGGGSTAVFFRKCVGRNQSQKQLKRRTILGACRQPTNDAVEKTQKSRRKVRKEVAVSWSTGDDV